MAKSTSGSSAAFTYDFGISIAQSTVNKVVRLTGATLSLASAFYALKTTAAQYVDVLRENTLRYGGVLSTMLAIEQAQKRILKGQSQFGMEDQLTGMNRLAAAGVDIRNNLDWITKAAHATGKSFSEFSGIVASAISGNMQGLVDMGLLTQRAVRMFEKYPADTIMRQQAILNFVKTHKGLQAAIKNDFETIQDQMLRIKTSWQEVIRSIVGKPNDPGSLYGQVTSALKMVAESMSSKVEAIKRYGYMIGQVLGWVIKQIGHFAVWIGRVVSNVVGNIWKLTDDFQQQTKSLIVWLEFWKLKIVDFFKEYEGVIKTVVKWLLIYKVARLALTLTKPILTSIWSGIKWLKGLTFALVDTCRHLGIFKGLWHFLINSLPVSFFTGLSKIMSLVTGVGRAILGMFTASNPIGWIILAISLFVVLYKKSEKFRNFVNKIFTMYAEKIRLLWNTLNYIYVLIRIGFIEIGKWFVDKIWNPIKNFFSNVLDWIGDMWTKFKDSSVGKWIDKWIVQPLKTVFEWVAGVWNKIVNGIQGVIDFFRGANDTVINATNAAASQYGIGTALWTNPVEVTTPTSGPLAPASTGNPMMTPMATTPTTVQSSPVTVSSGAIQIVVQNGENIDENVLAQKVREVLEELQRGNIRGGE